MPRDRRLATYGRILALAAACFVSGCVGLRFPYFESTVTLIWAPSGIAVAALLCWGLRVWPGAAIGAFAVNLTTGVPLETVVLITAGNTLAGIAGAALLNRLSRGSALDAPGAVLRFLVLGVAVGPLVSSLNGAAAVCLTLLPCWDGFLGIWRGWWIGDAMGVLLFAPPLLQLARGPWRGRPGPWYAELGLLTLCAVAISILVHRVEALASQEFLFIFVSLPFALWGVVRFGGLGAAVVNLAVCLTAIAFLTGGNSFFIADDPQASLLRFYGFFSVVGIAGLLLAAYAETAELHETADPDPAQGERIRRIRTGLAVGCGGLGLAVSIAAAILVAGGDGVADEWQPLGILMIGALMSGGLSLYLLSLTRAEERVTRLVVERSRLLQEARLEAEAALAQAQQASRAKSEFLAHMSHELRSPLNAIIGYAELALNDPQSQGMSAQARTFIETVMRSGRHLASVVGDLLDLSAIEAGRLRIDRVPFDLRDVARDAMAIVAGSADANRNSLAVDVNPAVPDQVVGDPVRVRQVMLNLLSNAVSFTSDGSIRLTVEPLAETDAQLRLRVCVTDTGVGIAESRHGDLFRAFAQGDMSTTRAFGGTGLGLAVSQKLVQAMGGEIGFRSAEGTGSAFLFDVSLDRAAPAPAARAAERSLSLLLVEDVEINRMLAERLLENAGHTVVSAGNGVEALEAIERRGFDAVVMDIQMPVLDGVEATKRIRQLADPVKRSVPIVALTANVARDDLERYRAAGIDECCAKPLVMDVLSPILDALTRGRPARQCAAADG